METKKYTKTLTPREGYKNRHIDGVPTSEAVISIINVDVNGEETFLCKWMPFDKSKYTNDNMPYQGYMGCTKVIEGRYEGIGFNLWENNDSEFIYYKIVGEYNGGYAKDVFSEYGKGVAKDAFYVSGKDSTNGDSANYSMVIGGNPKKETKPTNPKYPPFPTTDEELTIENIIRQYPKTDSCELQTLGELRDWQIEKLNLLFERHKNGSGSATNVTTEQKTEQENKQIEARKSLKETVLSEYQKGNIVVVTIDGIEAMPLKEFVKQPVEGMLYDLNRNELTVLAFIEDKKWINDFACGKVIRELKNQIEELKKTPQPQSYENLQQLIQNYLGMTPKDKNCTNWLEMQEKMKGEITELFKKEIQLFQYRDFIGEALNHYWHDAKANLERKDLGDIERNNYNTQLRLSKSIMKLMDLI